MSEQDFVKRVIAKYGPTLDLEARPDELIDIIRSARLDEPGDGGAPPGGAPTPPPPPPPPPPGPTSVQPDVLRLEDVMAEVLRLSRQVTKSARDIKAIKGQLGVDG